MKKKHPQYRIVFLRHAESVGNAEGYFQGQSDFPLTERGRAQAHALATRWKEEARGFDRAISSPLSRTRETSEIVAKTLGIPLEFDPIWMERHNGDMAGLKHEEGRRLFPQPPFRNPYESIAGDGEGDWRLFMRAGHALQGLLEREPGRYLVVSHGGLLNQVMKAVVGITPQANYQGAHFRFGNTAFATVVYFPQTHRWNIEGMNDRTHWREDE
ncbi:MAG: hypothetical protein B5M51_01970 [Anaerolinea sp. 4484_236]|nr:MAG: hypothetical protein B5M51_01970 [Anaerolinea sp. 4484_236]